MKSDTFKLKDKSKYDHPLLTDGDVISSAYFIGAGGIGMSAIIRYFLSKGIKVGGYDLTPSALTEQLIKEGADIHFEDDIKLIHKDFLDDRTIVVYTPAVPEDLSELQFFRNHNFRVLKRAQLLGLITEHSRSICVAGTHGKTTTSSMIAHLLKQSKIDCNAFLGGILKNYNSNLLLSDHSNITVIEADEYDRSFHWLRPCMAVITSTDPDHLDIYGTHEAYREAFLKFISLIKPNGTLIIKKGVLNDFIAKEYNDINVFTYSVLDPDSDFYAENIRVNNGEILFDFINAVKKESIKNIQLGVPVRINIENGVAALAAASLNGVTAGEMKYAIETFKGSERRFDIRFKSAKTVYIDDYAHHPQEIESSIRSIKELYPDRKITGIFRPHLYTRTRDFADAFAKSLSLLDKLILLDIYPAREEPIDGVSSDLILNNVTIKDKIYCKKTDLIQLLEKDTPELLVTLGAGDIDRFVEPITKMLKEKQ